MAVSFHNTCIICIVVLSYAYSSVVFQPSFVVANGRKVTVFLLGDSLGMSLVLNTVQPSNTTALLPPPSCTEQSPSRWIVTKERFSKSTVKLQLSLNGSLQLCGNETDCCPHTVCVQETLQVSACENGSLQASVLVQAEVYALIYTEGPVSGMKSVIPNQAYQPLGSCPCDLTPKICDIRCCCDTDCSPATNQLFSSQCFPGVFGGNITPTPEYQCSVQSSRNAPDWFPFLCVTSSTENSPFLGLFFMGASKSPKHIPSLQAFRPTLPLPGGSYRQGDPILTEGSQYFTIPQTSLVGECVENAPVAFLQNFQSLCPVRLVTCPDISDLGIGVKDGFGGVIVVSVKRQQASDLSSFVSRNVQREKLSPTAVSLFPGPTQPPDPLVTTCQNLTLALDYTFNWRGNGINNITLVQTIGNVALESNVSLTVRYSAVFLNGNASVQPNSGNLGYVTGKPVIGGSVNVETGVIQRASLSFWQPVGEGLCATASMKPIIFRQNTSAGCLLRLAAQDMTQCSLLREMVQSRLASLVTATHIAKLGNPDVYNLDNWINVTYLSHNVSNSSVVHPAVCTDVPSHLNIQIYSTVSGLIHAAVVSFTVSTWRMECGGGDPIPCLNQTITQIFPVYTTVTFTDVPSQPPKPKTKFQINFTEFDCDRNEVCWPHLAYPFTRYYKGEPYSMSLAKGLTLVFFFVAASLLGTPWRQICQVWRSAWL